MRRRRMPRNQRHRDKPEWLLAAEWKRHVYLQVGPRVLRTAQRLANPDRLSIEQLIGIYQQAKEDLSLILSTMKPEIVEEMLATDPRFLEMERLRKDTAAVTARLLARQGIGVLHS